ncbi:uncharacterized protein A4U43_UnF9960 [Asparagus officinalis]|uniref:Uncharacterized protein n=1 Tax=Asparagus officinalis TaxID=4686 RepID=A0A1R3L5L1_ASPOF|nr:uncharacterized protein A4U43_UnF9960 [Asparagus officinalis]
MAKLREMLEYIFNIKKWDDCIIPANQGSFLVELPFLDLLKKVVSSQYMDMGYFGGAFAKWSERKGLHVFTEVAIIWVKISSLPCHIWDNNFFALPFKDVGVIHAFSRDVKAKEEARDYKDKVEVVYERKNFLMEMNFWGHVYLESPVPLGPHLASLIHLLGAPMEPALAEDPKIHIPISNIAHIIESSSSLALSPSCERVIRRWKPAARSLAHKPLHQCLVTYSSCFAPAVKNSHLPLPSLA